MYGVAFLFVIPVLSMVPSNGRHLDAPAIVWFLNGMITFIKAGFQAPFERLAKTDPLPEMTGRVCPAPCEKGCTEALNGSGVTIR